MTVHSIPSPNPFMRGLALLLLAVAALRDGGLAWSLFALGLLIVYRNDEKEVKP